MQNDIVVIISPVCHAPMYTWGCCMFRAFQYIVVSCYMYYWNFTFMIFLSELQKRKKQSCLYFVFVWSDFHSHIIVLCQIWWIKSKSVYFDYSSFFNVNYKYIQIAYSYKIFTRLQDIWLLKYKCAFLLKLQTISNKIDLLQLMPYKYIQYHPVKKKNPMLAINNLK